MAIYYILDEDGKTALPIEDMLAWAEWLEKGDRVVMQTTIFNQRISTVFLGLDHRYYGSGPPILWETMVFGGADGGECKGRYSSYDEALDGHIEEVWKIIKENVCD